jgi:hypothetical protein
MSTARPDGAPNQMSPTVNTQPRSNTLSGAELEAAIAGLLECRFGDGLVYMPKHRPTELYAQAQQMGFIDPEGFLTRKGRLLLAQYR